MLGVGIVGIVASMDHYLWYNWDTDPTSSQDRTQSGSFDVIKKKGLNGVNTSNWARVSQSNYVWPRSSGSHMGSRVRIINQFGSRLSHFFFFVPRIIFSETDSQHTLWARLPSPLTATGSLLSSLSGFWPSFLDRSGGGREGGRGDDGDIRRLPDCWQTVQQTPTWCQQTRLEGADTWN